MPVKSYQDDLLQRLSNIEYAAEYLKVSFDETMKDGNIETFLLALKNVVKATKSIPIVKSGDATDDSQEQLSQLLEMSRPLTLETLGFVLRSVGLTLDFQPAINHKK